MQKTKNTQINKLNPKKDWCKKEAFLEVSFYQSETFISYLLKRYRSFLAWKQAQAQT